MGSAEREIENQPITAAVVQAAPVVFDLDRTIEKLQALAADAARRRADITCFRRHLSPPTPRGWTSALE